MTTYSPYATDEDVALRAPGDFALLCPRDQKLASGSDGEISPADRWTLRSISVDFEGSGLDNGHVVQILGPSPAYRPPGEILAIEAASLGSATLRRLGQGRGAGQPPAPAGGASGVEFLVLTLAPQIARASLDLDRRFGVGAASGPLDPREVREAVVLGVLHNQYLAMSRESGDAKDPFAAKARAVKAELDEILARLVVRSGPGGPASRFCTRLSR